MADTLTTLTTVIRDHLDEATAGYWSDAEIQRQIVRAYRRLWSKIIAMRDDWFLSATPATISVLADGTLKYAFPSDFFRVSSIRTSTSGKEYVRWIFKSSKDPMFIDGLRPDIVINDPDIVYYDVVALQTLMVSPLPRTALTALAEYYTIPTDPTTTFGGVFDAFLAWIEAEATAVCLAKGPTGDPAFWKEQQREAWAELLPVIGAPRSGQGNQAVIGFFDQ